MSDTVNPTGRNHHAPAPWRDSGDFLKAYFAHLVLSLKGDLRAFTLNLGGEVEVQARGQGEQAARWLSQRINRHLQSTLGRKVLYWFRLEIGDGKAPYLHLHGELACSDEEIDAVREALRMAGGLWAGLKQTQVDTKRKNPDTGWVSYAMGLDHVDIEQKILRGKDEPRELSWRDGRFFIGQELSRRAKEIYEEARAKIKIKTISWQKACALDSENE